MSLKQNMLHPTCINKAKFRYRFRNACYRFLKKSLKIENCLNILNEYKISVIILDEMHLPDAFTDTNHNVSIFILSPFSYFFAIPICLKEHKNNPYTHSNQFYHAMQCNYLPAS